MIFGLIIVAVALINLFVTKFDSYRLNILTLIIGSVLVLFGGIDVDHIELLLILLGCVTAILSFFMYWKVTSAPWTFGFDGDDDFGYYDYQDNFGLRATGWFFWLIAFGLKLAMLYFCYLQLFCGGIHI